MIKLLKMRWKAAALWLAMFGLAVGCSFWRLFLPHFYTTPGIWALWHKPVIALFLIPLLFLCPLGFYRWFPALLQKLKLGSRPWLCCIILLAEILAVWAIFGKKLYSAGGAAVAVVVSTLLFFPRMEMETVQKPFKWLVTSIIFLCAVAACSALLWRVGASDYAMALAVGLAYTAWLILSVFRKENPVNRWWLSVLPFTVVFAIALTLHAFSADAQAEVSAWRAGENFYTAMRSGNIFGSTLMNIFKPGLCGCCSQDCKTESRVDLFGEVLVTAFHPHDSCRLDGILWGCSCRSEFWCDHAVSNVLHKSPSRDCRSENSIIKAYSDFVKNARYFNLSTHQSKNSRPEDICLRPGAAK